MKHLTTYRLFESVPISGNRSEIEQYANRNKEIKRTCDDILLDISDEGYFSSVTFDLEDFGSWGDSLKIGRGGNIKMSIRIAIRKSKQSFLDEEVKPVVDRLISYLESEGFAVTLNSAMINASSAGPQTERSWEIHFIEI